jgi:hypothetical protein
VSQILVGDADRNFVLIEILSRERVSASDFWDGNWLIAYVRIRCGGFQGQVQASLRSEELVGLRDSLASLQADPSKTASYTNMEDWLTLEFKADRLGHISLTGELIDAPGIGNRLAFGFDLDQSYLPAIVAQLDSAIQAFPVKGQPTD